MQKITVIGGGVARLTAAITCAEQRAAVELVEGSSRAVDELPPTSSHNR